MRIGELSERTGVATRMLRYYEEQGLLHPRREGNGYREFEESSVQDVVLVRDLVASGVPTRFVKIVLDRQSDASGWTERCDAILAELVREQVLELDAKIDSLTMSRRALLEFAASSDTVRGGRRLAVAPADERRSRRADSDAGEHQA